MREVFRKFKPLKSNDKIAFGDTFAVHTGSYAGQMFIFVEQRGVDYCFLSVPLMENRVIPVAVFDHGRNSNIIKFVERVPPLVRTTAHQQYKNNENADNRRQQFDPPNVLDSEESS